MSELDELRATLERHAGEQPDGELVARLIAVRRRVDLARRRRRAVVAGVVTAAIVATLGAVVALRPVSAPERPADAPLVVPRTMTSLGFTFDHDRVVGRDRTVTVRLASSSRPRLVTWATSGSDQSVRVDGAGFQSDRPYVSTAPDFDDFVVVDPGPTTTLRLTAHEGEVEAAVYDLDSSAPPAGYTRDGVTFRQHIAGGHLLAAAVGRPGQAELRLSATADGPGVEYRFSCTGPKGTAITATYHNGRFLSDGCADLLPYDAVSTSGSGMVVHRGERLTALVRLTRGLHGPLAQGRSVRIAVGIYALDRTPATRGSDTPLTTEAAGHLWRRVETSTSTRGAARLDRVAPQGRGEVLAVFDGLGTQELQHITIDGRSDLGMNGGAIPEIVSGGSRVGLSFDRAADAAGHRLRIAFYVRAD